MHLLKRRHAKPQPPALTDPVSSEEVIMDWLAHALARMINLKAEDVDVTVPLVRYGLDSVQAVRLSGELEEWLGRPLAPSLVYEYPTIASLARYLVEGPGAEAAPLPAGLNGEGP